MDRIPWIPLDHSRSQFNFSSQAITSTSIENNQSRKWDVRRSFEVGSFITNVIHLLKI